MIHLPHLFILQQPLHPALQLLLNIIICVDAVVAFSQLYCLAQLEQVGAVQVKPQQLGHQPLLALATLNMSPTRPEVTVATKGSSM